MTRFLRDDFVFDFGDDDSGIYWNASVTVDTEYDVIDSWRITGVHVGGKVWKWDQVDSELQNRIRERMNAVETAEFLP